MSIEEIIEGLKGQGLDEEGCRKALEEMAEKGEITDEDLKKGLELLGAEVAEDKEAEEEAYAEKLFGI